VCSNNNNSSIITITISKEIRKTKENKLFEKKKILFTGETFDFPFFILFYKLKIGFYKWS